MIDGERKTVSALFADIKGSTELMEELDPEEARAIVDPALKLMIDAVQRYDGYVVQSTGDGIFAIFGAPIAHEDHPQRALYAALRMQEELRRYSTKLVAGGGIPSRHASAPTPARFAVIGKEFPLELIRAVTDRDDDELEPILSDLRLGEFIYEQPTVSGTEYTFKHALTQEVAYNSILAERRRAVHERAGEAIEARYAERPEDHLSELARHYRLGNNPAKAVRYSQLAAERAANRAAYGEAADTAAAALKLLDRLPDGTDRLRAELNLRMIENSASVVLHGFASREHQLAIERICELTEQLGENALLLGGLTNLANLYFARGEPMRTLELGRRCVDLAANTQDAEVLAICSFDGCVRRAWLWAPE